MGLAQASDERVAFIGHNLHIVSETGNELYCESNPIDE